MSTGAKQRWRGGRGAAGPLAAALAVGLLMATAPPAEGRLLNIVGQVDLEYRLFINSSDFNESENSVLRETIRAGTGGDLFREAIGRYRLNFSFLNEDRAGEVFPVSGDQNRQSIDYFAGIELIPRVAPLSLSVQRVEQESDVDNIGATGVVTTTYNLLWQFPRIWVLPQLRLHLFHNTINPSGSATQRIFGGSISATDEYPFRYIIKNTELNWSITFSSTDQFENGDGATNIGGRVTADSVWTSAMTTNLRAAYTTDISHQTPDVPGGYATSTTVGGTLFYRPSLRLNSSASYDYFADVFDRHIARADAFYRPGPQLDINTSLQALYYDLDQTQTYSMFGNGLVVYRPMLNLTTSVSATLGYTDIHALTDARSFSQHYAGSVSYFKVLNLVQLNTGAGLGYGNVLGTGDTTHTVSSNWFAILSNTKTQYVTVTGGYNGYYNGHFNDTESQLWTHTFRADAMSSYFRELLLRGDNLILHAGGTDTIVTNQTDRYNTLDLVFDANYLWQSIGATTGVASHISTGAIEDFNTYFAELRWSPPMWYGLSTQFRGRYEREDHIARIPPDVERAFVDVFLNYQIGLVQLSTQYQFSFVGQLAGETFSHHVFVRLTRRFSF